MQATKLPLKMIEEMMLRFVHWAIGSTPPHFVVNVMNTVVQSVLTPTLVGTKLSCNTCHMC